MKKYKLIALNCTAKGNRVLRKEDNKVYTEDAWDEKVADTLVKEGFLEVVGKTKEKEAPKKVETPKKKETPKPKDEKKDDEGTEADETGSDDAEDNDIPAYEDVTGKQMKGQLIARGEEVKSNESKKDLYKRLYGVNAK